MCASTAFSQLQTRKVEDNHSGGHTPLSPVGAPSSPTWKVAPACTRASLKQLRCTSKLTPLRRRTFSHHSASPANIVYLYTAAAAWTANNL